MHLRNVRPHMMGKGVSVNGNVYTIDKNGIAWNVDEVDGKKLLQGKSWRVFNPGESNPAVPPAVPEKAPEKHEPPVMPPPTIPPAAPPVAPPVTSTAPAQSTPPADPSAASDEAGDMTGPDLGGNDSDEGEGESDGTMSWPEPVETMEPAFLREMADAYGVLYGERTQNSTLVKHITKKMYPDGKPEAE